MSELCWQNKGENRFADIAIIEKNVAAPEINVVFCISDI